LNQSRLCLVILLFGLLQCGLLGLIAVLPAAENVGGLAHPLFNSMRVGGDGAVRFLPVAGLAYWFQILVLAQICCMIALGVRPNRRSSGFWVQLGASFGLLAAAWTVMYQAYEGFLVTGQTQMVAGWPYPTAWQVYAIWLSGFGLVALYVVGFKAYVWSDDDETRFRALVKQYPAR
jgi:hypothetical protein